MQVFDVIFSVLFCLGLICGAYASGVETALQETIKDALSIDLSLYNREEELFVNVINQDGYRICSAKINKHSHGDLDCKKDGLRGGDNTFFVTLYSLKNKTILKEAVTHFHYDNMDSTWLSKAIHGAHNNILCAFRSGEEFTLQLIQSRWTNTDKKLASIGGVLLAGAYATYGGPVQLAVCKDIIMRAVRSGMEALGFTQRPRPLIAPITGHTTDHDSRPPPPAPPPAPSATHIHRGYRPVSRGLLAGVRRNMQKFATARSAQYGVFLLTVGLMHGDRLPLQPIGTQLARLQRRATALQLHRGHHVVVEIPVQSPPPQTVLEIAPPAASEPPQHHQLLTPQVQTAPPLPPISTKVAPVVPVVPVVPVRPPPLRAPAVAAPKRKPSLVSLLLRMRDALSAKFHAHPPARRQYWSRLFATGVVLSLHRGTELGKRITVQDVLVAVQEGVRKLLSQLTGQKLASVL